MKPLHHQRLVKLHFLCAVILCLHHVPSDCDSDGSVEFVALSRVKGTDDLCRRDDFIFPFSNDKSSS